MDYKNKDLYEKLSRLQWLLQRQQICAHAQHGPFADPTRGQGRVLAILKMQPEISTKDLAYLLGIRQQSLNELLNKLEKAEYVERVPSEADRRVMMVRLTEKGKETKAADTDYDGLFECLTEEEQAVFGDCLDRVIAALEEQLGIDEDEDHFDWMRSVRERYGEAGFERMMAMRGGRPPFGGRDGSAWWGDRHKRGHGDHDHHGRHGEDRPDRGRFDGDRGGFRHGCGADFYEERYSDGKGGSAHETPEDEN